MGPKVRFFWINNLFKNLIIQQFTKFWELLLCLNIDFKVISRWKFSNGLVQIHKSLEDGTSSFYLILSAIGTPTYNLAKFCNRQLKPLTSNDYTVKESLLLFIFVQKFYKHCDRVVVGSTLESMLANVFRCHFEKIF